jgi:hypothetical protein
MKKLILLFISNFFLLSCEKINQKSNTDTSPDFKIYNNSKDNIDWIKIYVGDRNVKFEGDSVLKYTLMYDGGLLKANEALPMFTKKLKEYSTTGDGTFKIESKKVGSNDISSTRFGNFENFNFYNNSFPEYRTYEITFINKNSLPAPNENLEIRIKRARYDGEKLIESF